MRRLGTLLALGVGVFVAAPLAHDSVAQTTDAPSKSGTRLITLGTVAGPPPRAHRAQSFYLSCTDAGHWLAANTVNGAGGQTGKGEAPAEVVARLWLLLEGKFGYEPAGHADSE
jgi:hypothetical protein